MRRTSSGLAVLAVSAAWLLAPGAGPTNAASDRGPDAPSAAFWSAYNQSMTELAEKHTRPGALRRDRSDLNASASAFRGKKSPTTSRRLVGAVAPTLVARDALVPPATEVKEILSPTALLMRDTGGRSAGTLVSNMPLATTTPGVNGRRDRYDLADLSWSRGGSDFDVTDPVVPVSVSATSGGKIAIGSDIALRVPDGATPATGVADGETLTYPSIAADTDLIVRSLPTGVQFGWLLRSPAAQTELRVPFDLRAGQRLVRSAGDSIQIRDGQDALVAEVSTVSVVDADRMSVPVTTRLDGDAVVYEVEHGAGTVKYPLVVDPQVADVHWDSGSDTATDSSDGWFFQNTPLSSEPFIGSRAAKTPSQRGQLGIFAPQQAGYSETAAGAWARFAPGNPNASNVTVQSNGRRVAADHAWWYRFDAGSIVYGAAPSRYPEHYFNYFRTAIGMLDRNGYADGQTAWSLLDANGSPGAPNSGPMFDKLPSGTNGTSASVWMGGHPTDPARGGRGPSQTDNAIGFGLNAPKPSLYWQYEHPVGIMAMGWYRAWAADNVAPTVSSSAIGDGTWKTSAPTSFPINAGDNGMGVKSVEIQRSSDGNVLASAAPNCPAKAQTICSFGWSGTLSASSVPEGRSPLRIRTTDAGGLPTDTDLNYAVDRSAPDLVLSGSLVSQAADPPIGPDTRSLTIRSADGSLDSNAARRSGVQRIEIYANGVLVKDYNQTASGDSQPLNPSEAWQPATGNLMPGETQILVRVIDRVGNAKKASFVVTTPEDPTLAADGLGDPGTYTLVGPDPRARVNVASGNLVATATDIRDTRTSEVALSRTYNSLADLTDTGLGARWSFDAGPQVRADATSDGSVDLRDASGYSISLPPLAGSTDAYDQPLGFDSDLLKRANGRDLINSETKTVRTFSNAGSLGSVTDGGGSQVPVTYGNTLNGSNRLMAIGNAGGSRVTVNYGLLSPNAVAAGNSSFGSVSYSRNGNLLTGVRAGLSALETYGYDANGRLSSIARADGSTLQVVNDSQGRVLSLTAGAPGGGAQTWTFTYTSSRSTTVTGPTGTTVYNYDDAGQVIIEGEDESSLPLTDDDPDPSLTEPQPLLVASPNDQDQVPPGTTVPEGEQEYTDLVSDESSTGTANRGLPGIGRYLLRSAGGWTIFRQAPIGLMIGNGKGKPLANGDPDPNANKFHGSRRVTMTDRKNRTGVHVYGRLFGHAKGCGWLGTGGVANVGDVSRVDCAKKAPATKKFAKIINCYDCGGATATYLRDGVTQARLYRNVRPWARNQAGHDSAGIFKSTRSDGKPATVSWRYITPDGKWAAIRAEQIKGGNNWAFIAMADLPPISTMCRGNKPFTYTGDPSLTGSARKKERAAIAKKNWPRVCSAKAFPFTTDVDGDPIGD